jgi:hypothetical protein
MVIDLEWAEVVFAEVGGADGPLFATDAAFHTSHEL